MSNGWPIIYDAWKYSSKILLQKMSGLNGKTYFSLSWMLCIKKKPNTFQSFLCIAPGNGAEEVHRFVYMFRQSEG